MKKLPLALLLFAFPVVAQDTPAPAPAPAVEKKVLPDFIRYAEGEKDARLETAVKSYSNADGVIVDLVGVVHIADAAYYKQLNERLATYDAVLYELVGDPAALKDANKNAPANPLRGIQKMAGNMLKLTFQLDHIDYTKPNFIHADLSAEEFSKLQEAKGENLMTLLARAMKMEKEGKLGLDTKDLEKDFDITQIMGLLSGSGGADSLKIVMAKVFDKAESMVDSFEGPDEKGGTVLLTERNKVVTAKLEESIKGGKKHLAIFYGAGHLPGLEVLIQNLKFKSEKEEWLAAWTMAKPLKK